MGNEVEGMELEPLSLPARIVNTVPSYQSSRPELLETTAEIKAITGPDDRELALTYARDCQAEAKAAEEHFRPYNQAANELRNKLAALRDGVVEQYRGELTRLNNLVLRHDQEAERKRREEQARLAAEAERKRREEQARIEAAARLERERIEREAQERAAALEAEGRAAAAMAEIERAAAEAEEVRAEALRQAQEVVAEPIIIPPVPEPARVRGSSTRQDFFAEYDPDILPLIRAAAANPAAFAQYLTRDEKLINAVVKRQGYSCQIPTVTVRDRTIMVTQASK